MLTPPSFALPFALMIIFITTFLFKRFLITATSSSKPQKKLPPSPPTIPILGNLHQLGKNTHRSLRQLARRHGPHVMLLRLGSRPVVVVSSPVATADVMKTHDVLLANRPNLTVPYKLFYQGRDMSRAPYGEYWRRMRSICVLNLLSAKRVQSFCSVREDETAALVGHIQRLSSLSLPVNLSETFVSLTNNVVCRVALGKKYGREESQKKHVRDLLSEFMKVLGGFRVGDYMPWLSWVNKVNGFDARVDRVAKEFDEFLDRVVTEHEEARRSRTNNAVEGGLEEKKDLVDVLLQVLEDTKMAGFSTDRENIKGVILDIFAGGTDTTSTVLEWAMAELLRHPNILNKLQDEVIEVTKGKPNISESDLEKMHYLRAIIKETLRLYPPVPLLVPRESSQDVKIKGFDVASGTMVITNAWAIGRDPALWDEPEEFKPERFLNSPIDFKGNDQFQLIPFGGGRRGCPGVSFAMVTIEFVLANLVHKFDWALPDGECGLDMTECASHILHRQVPLLAIATSRY